MKIFCKFAYADWWGRLRKVSPEDEQEFKARFPIEIETRLLRLGLVVPAKRSISTDKFVQSIEVNLPDDISIFTDIYKNPYRVWMGYHPNGVPMVPGGVAFYLFDKEQRNIK